MTARTADMKLDGNAIGGQLLAVFGVEMTVAMATCGSCGCATASASAGSPSTQRTRASRSARPR